LAILLLSTKVNKTTTH